MCEIKASKWLAEEILQLCYVAKIPLLEYSKWLEAQKLQTSIPNTSYPLTVFCFSFYSVLSQLTRANKNFCG